METRNLSFFVWSVADRPYIDAVFEVSKARDYTLRADSPPCCYSTFNLINFPINGVVTAS